MKIPCFFVRISVRIFMLNALCFARIPFVATAGPPASSTAPLVGTQAAGGGGNLPVSGDVKLGGSNGANVQGAVSPPNPPSSINGRNLPNSGNNLNSNPNGLKSNNNVIDSKTPGNGGESGMPNNRNINNAGANNAMDSRPGVVPNSLGGSTNSVSAVGNSNFNNGMETPSVPNKNKLNNGRIGVTPTSGLNNGVTHAIIGQKAKQTQHFQNKTNAHNTTKISKNGAQSTRNMPNEILSTYVKIFVAVILPFLLNKAVHIL